MSKDNPIDTFAQWYAKHGPNPLITALLLGGGAYGVGKVGWNSIVEVLRSLGRPIGKKFMGGDSNPDADRDWNESMDNIKSDSSLSKWVPAAVGALVTSGALTAFSNPQQKYKGLLKWHSDINAFNKSAMDMDYVYNGPNAMSFNSYVTDLDWNRPIHASNVVGLFKNDPHLDNEPYARNMGISIVQDAAMSNHTKQPTIGNIFDSAVNKIENKLTFGGLANVALKTAVANGVSRLFAGSIGAMCDLSPQAQQTLVDAGTWAGAITSMLN